MHGWDRNTAAQPLLINSIKKAGTPISKNISKKGNAKSPLSNIDDINDVKKSNQELENKLRLSNIFDDMMESCVNSPQHIAIESHMHKFFNSNRSILWEKRPNSNSFLSMTLKTEVSSSCSIMQQVINSDKPIAPDIIYDSDIILSFSLQSFDHQYFIPFRYPDGEICAVIQLSRHQNYSPFGIEESKTADFLMKKFKIYGPALFQKERIVGLASKVSQIGPLSQTANQIKKALESSFKCNFPDIWFLQLNDGGYYRFDSRVRDFIGVYKCSAGVVVHSLRNAKSTSVFTVNCEKVGNVKNFNSSSDGEPSFPILMSSIEFEGRAWCIALRGERLNGCYTKDDQYRLSAIVPFIARSLSFSGGFLRQNVSNEKKAINSKLNMLSFAESQVSSFDIESLVAFAEEKIAVFLNAEFCRVLIVDKKNLEFHYCNLENCTKFPLNGGFAGSAFSEKRTIISSKPEDDSKFDRDVDIGKSTKIRNLISFPVFDEKNSVIAVIVASNKSDGEFNEADESNSIILASFFGIALKNAQKYSSSFCILSKLNEFIKESNSENNCSKETIEKTLLKIKKFINASYLSLFIVLQSDSTLHEFVTLGEKNEDFTQYLSVCLKTRKPATFHFENQEEVVCCVPLFDEENVVGVIEFCYNLSEFNEEINLLESFAVIASSSIDKKYLKEMSDYEEEKAKLNEIIGQENIELFDTPSSLICSIDSNQLFDATFIVQGNSEIDLIKFVFKCFDQFNLKQEFRISNQKLFSFILNISKKCRNSSYYNWLHAVFSCLFCSFLLNKTKLDEQINKMEIFCLFIAALCHDLGQNHDNLLNSTNEKEIISRSILFKKQSVVEMNHCIELINVLSKESSNILSGIEKINLNSVLELIFYLIIQTDMSKHFNLINEYSKIQKENSFSLENNEHKKLQLSLFLKCADLSDCIKKFEYFNDVSQFICLEFFSQGSIEKVEGMKFTCDKKKRQFLDKENSFIGFLNFVVFPLFEVVCEYNKEIQYIKDYLVANIEKLNENDLEKQEPEQNENDLEKQEQEQNEKNLEKQEQEQDKNDGNAQE